MLAFTSFGQKETLSDLTPDNVYILNNDTCFSWCGRKLNTITEFKVKAEGAEKLEILNTNALNTCKTTNEVLQEENKELRNSNIIKTEENSYLVTTIENKEKTVKILSVVIGILTIILIL